MEEGTVVLRRSVLALPLTAVLLRASAAVRGKLRTPARLETAAGEVALTGDEPTRAVLADARLNGMDIEAEGSMEASGAFRVGPIHTRALHVHKDGRRLMISYWCEVCSIRTFSPGVCMCCQEETALDLKEKFEP